MPKQPNTQPNILQPVLNALGGTLFLFSRHKDILFALRRHTAHRAEVQALRADRAGADVAAGPQQDVPSRREASSAAKRRSGEPPEEVPGGWVK